MAKKARRSNSRGKTVKKPGKARSPKPAPSPKKRAKAAGGAGGAGGTGGTGGAGGSSAFGIARAAAIESFVWTHGTMDMLLDGFTRENAVYQASAADNHVLWTVGHLAVTYGFFASLFDAQPMTLPERYNEWFGFGSKPIGDAAAYPALQDVRAAYNAAFDRLIEIIKSQSDADLMKPPFAKPGSDMSWAGKTRLEAVIRMNHHEGWHQGQVATLRRALGMKGVY